MEDDDFKPITAEELEQIKPPAEEEEEEMDDDDSTSDDSDASGEAEESSSDDEETGGEGMKDKNLVEDVKKALGKAAFGPTSNGDRRDDDGDSGEDDDLVNF